MYPVMLQIGAMSVYPRLFDLGADDLPVTGPLFGAYKSFATVLDILPIDFKFACSTRRYDNAARIDNGSDRSARYENSLRQTRRVTQTRRVMQLKVKTNLDHPIRPAALVCRSDEICRSVGLRFEDGLSDGLSDGRNLGTSLWSRLGYRPVQTRIPSSLSLILISRIIKLAGLLSALSLTLISLSHR
ncbi:uncharacterized protein NECHADRAFT_88727 [Fusarium vanettenii 77-13-4]|uniref:Uncharacterized protein n=1 Tax=Fusarium vanettenii (strain ATCC MYA-4622 / CBS 123669 / FGSC 9596 / NRRL 45880 / 77-13-4) TaxID=660122 RepID=C7ZC41_FUSV7|nr:uncharacterized protein NECHADRAFT_88727 [Fusarium vanettenii 77-13-4]EEU38423.1 predicted protein [Fusarium vanettenii 77-13-4]